MATCVGFGIGAVATPSTTKPLLQSQIEKLENSNTPFGGTGTYFQQRPAGGQAIGGGPAGGQMITNGSGGPVMFGANRDYINELDVKADMVVGGQILLIAILLSAISSLGAVGFILRYDPVQILAERS